MGVTEPPVTLYSVPGCSFCERAKALLRARGVGFAEIDLSAAPEARESLVARTGLSSLPQVFIGEELIGGFDALVAADRAGRLKPLAASA